MTKRGTRVSARPFYKMTELRHGRVGARGSTWLGRRPMSGKRLCHRSACRRWLVAQSWAHGATRDQGAPEQDTWGACGARLSWSTDGSRSWTSPRWCVCVYMSVIYYLCCVYHLLLFLILCKLFYLYVSELYFISHLMLSQPFYIVSTLLHTLSPILCLGQKFYTMSIIFVLYQPFHALPAISMFCHHLILWQPF
jgi:hypothetical protein